ncbi:MAG TPA: hypothetical protein VN648_11445, partial [Candidatus Methylomirabilis sp.]|nr:hypothetical protein [Candidatus Methylomirabilis sp.]
NGGNPTDDLITAQLKLRSNKNPAETFRIDPITGFMIDREFYGSSMGVPADPPGSDQETLKIALFRLYLEPLGVAVDTWSMSVQSDINNVFRNTTYTFGDLFAQTYIPEITNKLAASLGGGTSCSDLSAASIKQYVRGF